MNHRESDWYKAIKDLPVGSRLRMPHDGCSIGDAMMVTKSKEGCNAWCFLCKQPGMFVPASPESLDAKLRRLAHEKHADESIHHLKALPLPMDKDPSQWPLEARIWLYKAGLNNADIVANNIYYHPPSSRVVIGMYDGTRLVYWQARGFNPDRPKYLNPSAYNRAALVARWDRGGDVVVLTEDWLSGYRVQRASGYSVLALLGTNLSDTITAQIVESKRRVLVYLDGDKAGQDASKKILKKLKLYGVEAYNIYTPKDPKLYSDRELREILQCH